MKIISNNCNRNFLTLSFIFVASAIAAPKNRQEKTAVPKAVVVDSAKFNLLPLEPATVPVDTEQLPQVNAAEDNYSTSLKSDAEKRKYFSVPEAVRNIREIARKESLLKSQKILFDYIREVQEAQFPDQQNVLTEAVKRNEAPLSEILFSKGTDELGTRLEALFKSDVELRDAVTYLGLVRLQSIYGDFSQAPEKVQLAQKIEKAYHRYDDDSSEPRTLKAAAGIGTTQINFGPLSSVALQKKITRRGANLGTEVRRIGMDLLWDLREKLLPGKAEAMSQKLKTELANYVPYERVYIDTFKQEAFGKGSPESIVIWRYRGTGKVYRKELVAVGLVSTAQSVEARWHLTGQAPGAQGNTPDGVWRVFGFDKYYLGGEHDQYDMRGMTLLSYGNSPNFNGRGFHLVFFSSPWGYNDSHGCIRTYTNTDEQAGLANVVWATINPMQLNQVDFADDFTNENTYVETPFTREIVKTIRDRVWITVFSKYDDGYKFPGNEDYSVGIQRQYNNFEQINGVSPFFAARKLLSEKAQKIIGPSYDSTNKRGQPVLDFKTRTGKYWAYDKEVREKLFDINFRR